MSARTMVVVVVPTGLDPLTSSTRSHRSDFRSASRQTQSARLKNVSLASGTPISLIGFTAENLILYSDQFNGQDHH